MEKKQPKLLIIGAGPKAAAVAAKCRVLREVLGEPRALDLNIPQVTVIEQHDKPAPMWNGANGFTTGDLQLGTSPEKDVGFPYFRDTENPEVTHKLHQMFSWPAYLIAHGKLGDWIDRGRPNPKHRDWSQYISWVLKRSACQIIYKAKVEELHPGNGGWKVVYRHDNTRKTDSFDGLLITGPGAAKRPTLKGEWPKDTRRIFFGDDFWRPENIRKLDDINVGDEIVPPILIVGGGETAASIAAYIADHFSTKLLPIYILTSGSTIFSRGEGFYENRIFTQPTQWVQLDLEARLETIRRADRGVFSPDAIARLANAPNVDHLRMTVESVSVPDPTTGWPTVNGAKVCQMLIFATGFDPLSFTDCIKDPELVAALCKPMDDGEQGPRRKRKGYDVELRIGLDLSVSAEVSPSKLYLPMLAGLNQGPGFPNLSCLGQLSDRILNRNTHGGPGTLDPNRLFRAG